MIDKILPQPTSQEWHYHIGECDNRLRAVIQLAPNKRLYIGLEYLSTLDNRWTHFPCVSASVRDEIEAEDVACQMFYGWRLRIEQCGPILATVDGLHPSIVKQVEDFRLAQKAL